MVGNSGRIDRDSSDLGDDSPMVSLQFGAVRSSSSASHVRVSYSLSLSFSIPGEIYFHVGPRFWSGGVAGWLSVCLPVVVVC